MAEALLGHYGEGRFSSYSAGSFPTGEVHPMSIAILKAHSIGAEGYRSKSWDEFTDKHIDIVITVCDAAAGESCPIFHSKPLKAHWGVADPAKFTGTTVAIQNEFDRTYGILEKRVKTLVALPMETMDTEILKQELIKIGNIE